MAILRVPRILQNRPGGLCLWITKLTLLFAISAGFTFSFGRILGGTTGRSYEDRKQIDLGLLLVGEKTIHAVDLPFAFLGQQIEDFSSTCSCILITGVAPSENSELDNHLQATFITEPGPYETLASATVTVVYHGGIEEQCSVVAKITPLVDGWPAVARGEIAGANIVIDINKLYINSIVDLFCEDSNGNAVDFAYDTGAERVTIPLDGFDKTTKLVIIIDHEMGEPVTWQGAVLAHADDGSS